MDIEKALLLPWWHAMSVPPDLQQIIIPISALPFIWHYCLWKGAWSVAVTSFIYGCVGAHFLKLAPFRWEPCSGCAWLCSVVGKGWGTARVVCAPTASESFMQPFSHTFAQDLLAGHCLTMHSCSYGTTLNGDMRLLRRCQEKQKPPSQAPNGLETSRSGWWQSSTVPLSFRPLCWGRVPHLWRLSLDRSLAGQSHCGLQPMVSCRSDCRSPEVSASCGTSVFLLSVHPWPQPKQIQL